MIELLPLPLPLFLAIVGSLLVIALLYKKYTAPIIPGLPRVNMLKYRKNLKEMLDLIIENATGEGKDKMIILDTPLQSFLVATHPDVAKDILKNDEYFPKFSPTKTLMSDLTKNSLVLVNKEDWKRQRSIIAPAFQYDYLKGLIPIIMQKTVEVIDVFPKGEVFDVKKYFYHFTVDVLGLSAFGVDFKTLNPEENEGNEYYKAYECLMDHTRTRFKHRIPIFIREMFPLPSIMRARQAKQVLLKMTEEIREKRKVEGDASRTYLIDMMLEAHPSLTNEEFTTNTFLFFLAGHETTASALNWEIYMLAKYPEIQAKVQAEVDTVLNGKNVNSETLKELNYLDMFIKEVLRYGTPITMVVSRKTEQEIQVDKYVIPKNTNVGISMYAIHHNAEFWPNPDVFDPERFAPNQAAKQHPFAFLPFSLGRRVCIGNNFSLMEQKIFLSTLLQKYTVSAPSDAEPFFPDPNSVTFVPRDTRIILTKRKL